MTLSKPKDLKGLDAANRVINRVITVSHSLNDDNVPTSLSIDVCVVYADGTSKDIHQLLDYSVMPVDVAMNIACEIVRGWSSTAPNNLSK